MRFGFILLAAAASMMLGFAAHAHEYTVGDLFIHHPAVNATPPGAKVAVGYFTIKNNGDKDDELLGVDAPGLTRRAEIHSMTTDGGTMKMRKLSSLAIPAHSDTNLSPHGNHIMFLELATPVKEKDKFEATLHFRNAGDVKVFFAGEPIGSEPKAHDHHEKMDMK